MPVTTLPAPPAAAGQSPEPGGRPDGPRHLTVLGGGPAGLGVAFYARERGIDFDLFERSPELGGLCRTFRYGDHLYDSGAHRFHDRDPEITADLRRLMGEELARVSSPSQIFDRGRYLDFPPTPLSWLRGRGVREVAHIGADFLKARWRPRPERTFEDLATNRYGKRLGQPLLIAYTEKLWGQPASALAPEVATRRLSGLGLRALFLELLPAQARRAHLDGAFLYPRQGYGSLCARLAAGLPAACLHAAHEVVGFECQGGAIRAVRIAGRPPLAVGGRVVSTLPVTALVRCLGDALPPAARRAAARLCFRHIRLVFLRLGIARHSRNSSIYVPDPRLAVSRISEPKNRSPAMAPANETGLVVEVPCSTGDAIDRLDGGRLAEQVIGELSGVGLLDPRQVLAHETRMLRNAYPVYTLDHAEHVAVIGAALAEIENLDLLGRGGLFWYSHLHDQLRRAKDYVRSLEARAAPLRESISPHILRSARKL